MSTKKSQEDNAISDNQLDSEADGNISEADETIINAKEVRQKTRLTESEVDSMKVHQLKEQLRKLKLSVIGRKTELRNRLKSYLQEDDNTEESEDEDEEEDSEEESDSEETETEEDDKAGNSYARKLRNRPKKAANKKCARKIAKNIVQEQRNQASAFNVGDVERCLPYFSGEDEMSVNKWISDFEEIGTLLNWSDVQKFIYGKRMLKGDAQQYVASERNITSWEILRRKLKREFKVEIDSATIHSQLYRRKRKPNESGRQYVYAMRRIANECDIEEKAIIKYVINGITDEESNKAILYKSHTLRELKKNLKLYDEMKKNSEEKKERYKKVAVKDRKQYNTVQAVKKAHCYSCGSTAHDVKECPEKSKGPKCFRCNEFGHIATNCKSKAATSTANVSCISTSTKTLSEVEINNIKCQALIDSGSDINVMRKDQYEKIGSPVLKATMTCFTGAGNAITKAIGAFEEDITLSGEVYRINIFVAPASSIPYELILGQNFLKNVEVHIREGEVVRVQKVSRIVDTTIASGNGNENECAIKENTSESATEKNEAVDTEERDKDKNEITDLGQIYYIEEGELDIKIQYKDRLEKLIENYKPVENVETKVETKIVLSDPTPVSLRPRRLAPKEKEILNKQIGDWLDDGIISPSASEFSSPVVIVPKKNGTYRVCIDYRQINKKIIRDRFPMPLIEDRIDELTNAQVFSVIDLKNGFFHVPVAVESRKYTSFVTPEGQYEFNKTPFGLCISPTIFLRFIDDVFKDLVRRKIVFTYVDDLIIPGVNDEDAFNKLVETLEVAAANGLNINWHKCQFLKKRIEFLGHEIENGRVYPGSLKVRAVKQFPEPKSKKQIQSFLGLTGYFRKFIKDYAKIACPLSDLTKQDRAFVWNNEQKRAFTMLKTVLSTKPILSIYNPASITELHTDASKEGYGAVLLQRSADEKAFRPVYYLSKKTTDTEKRYHSYELEVLAIIYAVKRLRYYLLGVKFKLVTDCEAFKKTLTKKDLSPKVARWALMLEEFEFDVEHRRGEQLKHVDALSRYPVLIIEDKFLTMLKKKQQEEDRLRVIRRVLEDGPYEDYLIENDILMKQKGDKNVIVVPACLQTDIIRKTHENGHFGVRKMKESIESEYYISSLEDKLKKFISCCVPCILAEKKSGKKEGTLIPIPKGDQPLCTYHVDHVGPMTTTSKLYRYLFVVVDGFSKFAWLYPTKTTNAKEVVSKLSSQQKIFGNPQRIISDRGAAFTSSEFKDYCKEEGIESILITTGVPRGNGQAERTIRTIIPILTKLSLNNPDQWYKQIDKVQRCLNSTFQRSVGMTPFEVIFGVKMRHREDAQIISLIEQEAVELFDETRNELRILAKQNLMKIQEEHRQQHNKGCKDAYQYKEGDLVFIKRTQFGSGLKIKQKYLGPYKVSKIKRNNRYEVIRVGEGEGPAITSTAADYMKLYSHHDDTLHLSSGTEDIAGKAECRK